MILGGNIILDGKNLSSIALGIKAENFAVPNQAAIEKPNHVF